MLKAFFTGDLICDFESVKIGFDLYESLPAGEDKQWALKPCMNSNPSPELDKLITAVILSSASQLNFTKQIKPLISKHTETD